MVTIVEVIYIDKSKQLLEQLVSQHVKYVELLYFSIVDQTNDFEIPCHKVFSYDDMYEINKQISIIHDELQHHKSIIQQTWKLLMTIQNYFDID
jgi:hypothetical protein